MLPGLQQPGDFTCTTSISYMCQPAKLCSDFCRREFVRRFHLNVSSAHTRTPATRAGTPHVHDNSFVTWCVLWLFFPFFFFLHLLGLCTHMKSDMWMNLCISGCGESIYAYMPKKERLHSTRVSHGQVWKHETFYVNELMKSWSLKRFVYRVAWAGTRLYPVGLSWVAKESGSKTAAGTGGRKACGIPSGCCRVSFNLSIPHCPQQLLETEGA